VKVKLYVEGGRSSDAALRQAIHSLFAHDFSGRLPSSKASGSREDAFKDFRSALKKAKPGEYPILLVDSESPVNRQTPWQHLKKHDGWAKPAGADDEQSQLMVQCMETWLVADRAALKKFFGKDFKESCLPDNNKLEAVSKKAVQKSLVEATQSCKTKYRKGQTSFELLGQLDPAALKSLPHFQRLYETLDAKLS
jgi:hypothetical protein